MFTSKSNNETKNSKMSNFVGNNFNGYVAIAQLEKYFMFQTRYVECRNKYIWVELKNNLDTFLRYISYDTSVSINVLSNLWASKVYKQIYNFTPTSLRSWSCQIDRVNNLKKFIAVPFELMCIYSGAVSNDLFTIICWVTQFVRRKGWNRRTNNEMLMRIAIPLNVT